jgi:hypothetical protein
MLTRFGQVVSDVNAREGEDMSRKSNTSGAFPLTLFPNLKFETCLTKEIGKTLI